MNHVNIDPDGREPDWSGLERLVSQALEGFRSAKRKDVAALRVQIELATVTSLEFTGHGFYADILVPKTAPPLTEPTQFGAVMGIAISGDELIGLNLFLDPDGRIVCLEGFNVGDIPFTGAAAFTVEMTEPAQQ